MAHTYEKNIKEGKLDLLDDQKIIQLVHYFEEEMMYHKAIDILNSALIYYPQTPVFYLLKAKILYKLGNYGNALTVIEKAELISPSELDVKILKARILSAGDKTEEAISVVEELKILCTGESLVEVLVCESYIHEARHETTLMYDSLVEALKISPKNEEVLERIWFAVELSKNYFDSIRLHEQLINQDPYSHLAWFNLGHALSCIGEYEKATDSLEYSFIVNKEFSVGYLDCADLCFQTQNFEKALEIYQEFKQNFEIDEEVFIKIAECHFELKQYQEARSELYTALEFDTYNEEIYFLLGKTYSRLENWNMAIKMLHKAIAIEDFVEDYYLWLGKAYGEQGSIKKAEQYLSKACFMAPEDSNYWAEYVMYLLKTREIEKALVVIQESKKYTYGANLLYCEFATLHFAGKRLEAIEVLQEALTEDIDAHSILFEIEPEFGLNEEIQAMINYYIREIIAENSNG